MTEKQFVTVGKGEDKHPIPVDYMGKNEKNYIKAGLEIGKAYQFGKDGLIVKVKKDKNGLLYFQNEGMSGSLSTEQYFLKSDLKNLIRVEKYDNRSQKSLIDKYKIEKENKIKNSYILQSQRLELGNKY